MLSLKLLVYGAQVCSRKRVVALFPLVHPQGKGLWFHGLAEVIPLGFLALVNLEELQLLKGFHTFGNDVQVQALAQADDGAHQFCVIAVDAQVADERLIRSEERRVGKVSVRVCLGGRRIMKKKKA